MAYDKAEWQKKTESLVASLRGTMMNILHINLLRETNKLLLLISQIFCYFNQKYP